MVYMMYQQYTTAVKEAYATRPRSELAQNAAAARASREWVESLDLDPQLRGALVEQLRALEDAFHALMR